MLVNGLTKPLSHDDEPAKFANQLRSVTLLERQNASRRSGNSCEERRLRGKKEDPGNLGSMQA